MCRTMGEAFADQVVKQQLLQLAEDYDRIADSSPF
jgi:hypothetical protein